MTIKWTATGHYLKGIPYDKHSDHKTVCAMILRALKL